MISGDIVPHPAEKGKSRKGGPIGGRKLAPARGLVQPGCAPHSLFETSKRECAAPGGREKMSRRVGPHTCGPPAAGEGRLAFPRGGQGRKRAALGEPFGPGKPRISSALISAAANCPLRVKEEQRPFDFPPRRPPRRTRGARVVQAHGPARAGRRSEVSPTPIRKTPVRAEGHCTGARQSVFSLWTGRSPFLFLARQKRGPRRAPRGGERRRSGGSETWPCGPGQTIRSLCRRQWGAESIAGYRQIPRPMGRAKKSGPRRGPAFFMLTPRP